jgi:2-oxoglutarate dehydrogenase E2 component (dihydrolipoamide succinyltransferase)
LVNEEDTVTVGQDLLKMELGSAPSGGKQEQGGSTPKAPASDRQETSSQPDGQTEQKPSSPAENKPAPPKQESKPSPPKQESKPSAPSSSEPKSSSSSPFGNREEKRVCDTNLV